MEDFKDNHGLREASSNHSLKAADWSFDRVYSPPDRVYGAARTKRNLQADSRIRAPRSQDRVASPRNMESQLARKPKGIVNNCPSATRFREISEEPTRVIGSKRKLLDLSGPSHDRTSKRRGVINQNKPSDDQRNTLPKFHQPRGLRSEPIDLSDDEDPHVENHHDRFESPSRYAGRNPQSMFVSEFSSPEPDILKPRKSQKSSLRYKPQKPGRDDKHGAEKGLLSPFSPVRGSDLPQQSIESSSESHQFATALKEIQKTFEGTTKQYTTLLRDMADQIRDLRDEIAGLKDRLSMDEDEIARWRDVLRKVNQKW